MNECTHAAWISRRKRGQAREKQPTPGGDRRRSRARASERASECRPAAGRRGSPSILPSRASERCPAQEDDPLQFPCVHHTMESIIELQRQEHEEIERYEQALADILNKHTTGVSWGSCSCSLRSRWR